MRKDRNPHFEKTRRDFLRVGSLGLAGLSLSSLLRGEETAGKPAKAKACILLFMEGGPAHQDLWDMKPDAPAEYCGEFSPIATSVPGIQVCEHLPQLAQQMHHVMLVRSVHHRIVDHNAGAYYALTGRAPLDGEKLIVSEKPDNFPHFGAVLSRLHVNGSSLPPFVHLPDLMSNMGFDLPGQRAGFLGASFDPLVAGDPSAPDYAIPGLGTLPEVPPARVARRRALLQQLDRARLADDPPLERLTRHQQQAFDLMTSTAARGAFDLEREPQEVRERYGLPDRDDRTVEARKFGGLPHLGQCMLMARRLVEAGVRLVTVCSGRRFDQAWDTHRDHFPLLKKSLLPYADQALSALLEDLSRRGLLDETLVVAMGEFGRTPKLGQTTSNAGTDAAGRDHWPGCYTVLMAGGGIRGGAVHGASDRFAAYPVESPVTPEDIAATIYHALGLNPESQIYDPLGRPHAISLGKPILPLFG